MAAKKPKKADEEDAAQNQPDEQVHSGEAKPQASAPSPQDSPAESGITTSDTGDRKVWRRTTRTIKRSGDQYDTEIEEVAEEFDAPPLMDRTGSDYPSPVG